MRIGEIRERAFAMPFASPSHARGPYRFVNREYLIITYRTDAAALELKPHALAPVAELPVLGSVAYDYLKR